MVQAALVLHDQGLLPEQTHITILDTPFMDHPLIDRLVTFATVDFYQSSSLAMFPPEANQLVDYSAAPMERAKGKPALEAHSFANDWYIETVKNPEVEKPGYGRSPFAR